MHSDILAVVESQVIPGQVGLLFLLTVPGALVLLHAPRPRARRFTRQIVPPLLHFLHHVWDHQRAPPLCLV